MTYNLKDKIIVVIGGAGLIGQSFVRAIVQHEGTAIVADLDIENFQSSADEIVAKYPRKIFSLTLDITNENSIKETIKRLKKIHGKIDAVINCAYPKAGKYGCELEKVSYSDFCDNLNFHLGGFFLVSQQFAIYFKEQGYGNIVNIASIYATTTPRFKIYADTNITMPVEYAAIKAALVQLTRYFAEYFKGSNIRINCLSPGGILNNQPSLFVNAYNAFCNSKGMLEPDDINGLLLFLISDYSKYITGQNLIIDDGFSL